MKCFGPDTELLYFMYMEASISSLRSTGTLNTAFLLLFLENFTTLHCPDLPKSHLYHEWLLSILSNMKAWLRVRNCGFQSTFVLATVFLIWSLHGKRHSSSIKS